jgi:hypothetical protein
MIKKLCASHPDIKAEAVYVLDKIKLIALTHN